MFQLALTVGLLAVVVYLYTVVAFNFFRKFYDQSEEGESRDMKCDDMLTVSAFYLSLSGLGYETKAILVSSEREMLQKSLKLFILNVFIETLFIYTVLHVPHVRWRESRRRDRR